MAYDIGTARGVIEMEYNGRGIDQAQEDLGNLEGKGQSAQEGMRKIGGAAGKAGLAITAGLGAGVVAAANFEQRISAINAVSGATPKQLDAIRAKALQLGKDTQFSASESAQAMEELVKAGLSVDDVLNGAADATVALAAAGAVDMPTAATIASNAMNQFNLNAKDMVGVVDNIAGAANASAIDVGDFGQSLQQVGAVANLAGVNFKDTATAIALMGNAGIKGSDAGTSLKTMLQNLQPDTEKQSGLMKELGLLTYDLGGANKFLQKEGLGTATTMDGATAKLAKYAEELGKGKVGTMKNAKAVDDLMLKYGGLNNAFYDAEGNTKSLSEVSGVLAKSLKGMSAAQKQSALNTLFGSDAIRAAAVLANNGSKGFDKMAQSMGKVSAADVAAKRMDNFKGSLEQMKGSLETAGIAVGTILLPPLRQLVDAITGLLNKFLALSDTQQKWIVGILAAVGSLLLIISAVVKVVLFIQSFQAALIALRGTMIATWAAALGPIALVIAAIAAIIAIFVVLYKKNETFRKLVDAVWNGIKTAISAVATWLTGTFLPSVVAVWDAIVASVQAAWGFITGTVQGAISLLGAIIGTAVAILLAPWRALWATFGPVVRAAFGLIAAIIRLFWTIIKGLFILNLRFLMAVFRSAWNGLRAVTAAVWGAIKTVIMNVWKVIGPYVTGAVNRIKSVITAVWNGIKVATAAIWNGINTVIVKRVEDAVNKVKSIKDKVIDFFKGAGGWLIHAGEEIINGLVQGLTNVMHKVTDKINEITSKVSKFLPGSPVKEGPLKVLNHGYAGGQIVNMIADGISMRSGALQDAMSMAVTAPAGYAAAPASLAPAPRPAKRAGGSGGLRVVNGELRLDPSGRAFIRGVAVDADEDDEDYSDLLGRMNG